MASGVVTREYQIHDVHFERKIRGGFREILSMRDGCSFSVFVGGGRSKTWMVCFVASLTSDINWVFSSDWSTLISLTLYVGGACTPTSELVFNSMRMAVMTFCGLLHQRP